MLTFSDHLLVHFDPDSKLLLVCGVSSYGMEALLVLHLPDGSEWPVGYASWSLLASQRNFSHLKREALVLMFGGKSLSFLPVCMSLSVGDQSSASVGSSAQA